MESQVQNESENNNEILVRFFWVYTIIHFIILLYCLISKYEYDFLLVLSSIFISFLLTAIFVTVNQCKSKICICLIPSLINELIFIGLLVYFMFFFKPANKSPGNDSDMMLRFLTFIFFLFESLPNIILIVFICIKSKEKKSQIIYNIDNNPPLLNND